jgi:hypothetical protein
MSAIKLATPSSGSISLSPANTASNLTITVPAATTTMVGTDTTQTLTNKTLTTPNFDSAQFATVTGTAPIYPCRAWVNWNGTGTVAIRGSGNVSSITDDGTGSYTINFSTSMPDQNYACVGSAVNSSSFLTCITSASNNQVASIGLRVTTDAGSLVDPNFAYYAIFR